MALLLKKQKNTLKNKLTEYIRIISWIALLVLISFSLLHISSVMQYQKNTNQILTLNNFFDELDTNYQLLKNYVGLVEKSTLAELEISNIRLEKRMDEMKGLQINARFLRDMQDFSAIFSHYEEQNDLICQTIEEGLNGVFTAQIAARVVKQHDQAQMLYRIMTEQYKDLTMTLTNEAADVQEKLNKQTAWYYIILLAVFWGVLYMSASYASRLTEQIAAPIQKLEKAAKQVHSGRIENYEDVVWEEPDYDEAVSLTEAFNTMVHHLKDYILLMEENARTTEALHQQKMENLRMDSLLKASELKALQMQMNPHFLFNTLNMISVTADLGDTDKTVLLLQKTAQLLRYSLDYSGKTVTLAKEIEMLGNYVFLQEQRFGNRIFFDFDLDERFHQIQVPCFILQPLIENAVVHGLGGSSGKGSIIIRTKYLENKQEGWISIADDGVGMTGEELAQVLSILDSDREQREKIGLANINMRLKLLLEDRYRLEIVSSPGKGTEIRIRILFLQAEDL